MGGRGSSSMTSSASSEAAFSEEIKELVMDYVGTGYRTLRRAMRNESVLGGPANPATVDKARKLDSWLDGGSYGEPIYRGIGIKDEGLAQLVPGAEINQLDAMSSWSKDIGNAEEFSRWTDYNSVVFRMNGGTSHGRDIESLGLDYGEHEVTVSSHSTQRITAVHKGKNGIIYIDVEEV